MPFIHPLYTYSIPYLTPMYTPLYMYIHHIYTSNTPLNTPKSTLSTWCVHGMYMMYMVYRYRRPLAQTGRANQPPSSDLTGKKASKASSGGGGGGDGGWGPKPQPQQQVGNGSVFSLAKYEFTQLSSGVLVFEFGFEISNIDTALYPATEH